MLGTDFYGTTDLDPSLSVVSGRLALAQAVLRRLTSQRGTLLDDPTYGYDLRLLIGSAIREGEFEARILEQVLAEEEVQDATLTLTYSLELSQLTVALVLTDTEGPFPLTVTVNELSAEMLLPEAA